ALSQAPTERGPLLGLPLRLGRCAENPVISGAVPCAATSFESKTVKGVPLIRVAMPFNCHAPSPHWYQLWAWFQNGSPHPYIPTNRLRASNSESPRSAARLNGSCARSFSPAT